MTTQEKLKEIEQQIRRDIPRLMKPTEGCLVKYDNDIYKIVKYSGEFNLIVYQGEFDVLQPLTKRIHEHSIPSEDIIGHEIMINNILEWLNKKLEISENGTYYFGLNSEGNLSHLYMPNSFKDGGIRVVGQCIIDLSNPYLKDQSEELINFLYKLKNK